MKKITNEDNSNHNSSNNDIATTEITKMGKSEMGNLTTLLLLINLRGKKEEGGIGTVPF